MEIKTCMLTQNDQYTKPTLITEPYGIVVHSTGVNQKYLWRYVAPSDDDPNKEAIIEDIGKNAYGNSWNKPSKGKSVHFMIGCNKKDEVEIYQLIPLEYCVGGVASGSKGSFNYNPTACYQFEMLEDSLADEKYFNDVMDHGQWLCAYLCNQAGFGVDKVFSHKECSQLGYGSSHVDPHNWLGQFGKDMNWFRAGVQKYLDQMIEEKECAEEPVQEPVEKTANPAWVTVW